MSVTEFKRGVPTYKDKNDNEYGLLCETKEVCVTDNEGVSLEYKLQTLLQNINNIISGTQKVGTSQSADDSSSLGGHGVDYFAPLANLANFIKLDGSSQSVNNVIDLNTFYTGITLTNSSLNTPGVQGEWWLVIAGGTAGTTTQIAYNLFGDKTPKFRFCAASVWSDWYDLNKDYLPLNGGTLSGIDNILNLVSSSENAWIWFNTSAGRKGSVGYYGGISSVASDLTGARIGVTDDGTPQYWTDASGTARHILHHDGNSAKVVISQTAPSDTSALWVW